MFNLTYPLTVQVETTQACNHQCFYCYNYWRCAGDCSVESLEKLVKIRTSKKEADSTIPSSNKEKVSASRDGGDFSMMSSSQADRLVDIILNDIHPFHITVTGGEPLMNMKATLALARGLKKKGLSYGLNTNLTLLNEKRLTQLQEASTNNRFGILASLPHYQQEQYKLITGRDHLSIFYQNLRAVLHTGLPITINMVIHSLNKTTVYEEGKFLFGEFGITNFAATPMLDPSLRSNAGKSLAREEIKSVLDDLIRLHQDFGINVDTLETIPRCLLPKELRDNKLGLFNRACSAGRSTVSIGPQGEVRACSHAPYSVGNIFQDGFQDIWTRLKPYRENEYVPEDCLGCAEFYGCYGGCRFNGYQLGDSLNRPDSRMIGKVTKQELRKRTLSLINESALYQLNQNTVYRKEQESLYTFFNGDFSNLLFVNDEFKNFILFLSKVKRFRPTELDFGLQREKALSMMRILADRKYLQEEPAPITQ